MPFINGFFSLGCFFDLSYCIIILGFSCVELELQSFSSSAFVVVSGRDWKGKQQQRLIVEALASHHRSLSLSSPCSRAVCCRNTVTRSEHSLLAPSKGPITLIHWGSLPLHPVNQPHNRSSSTRPLSQTVVVCTHHSFSPQSRGLVG